MAETSATTCRAAFRTTTEPATSAPTPTAVSLAEQGTLGGTHGGFGNQYREFDTAAERPSAEATEEKYYGEGASEPGMQDNAYRNYDGRDERPSQQGHAVRDTPTPPVMDFNDNTTSRQPAIDGRGNPMDNRNLPSKTGEVAAFQNDNGSPTVGAAYAPDYGHTSGVGLPAGTPGNHVANGPGGRNQQEDQHSSRGGYDNQGSQQPLIMRLPARARPRPSTHPAPRKTPAMATATSAAKKPGPATPTPATRAAALVPPAQRRRYQPGLRLQRAARTTTRTPAPAALSTTTSQTRTRPRTTARTNALTFALPTATSSQDAEDTAPRRNAGRDDA